MNGDPMRLRIALLLLLLGAFPLAAEDLARLAGMIRGGNVAEARPKLAAAVKEYRTKGDAAKEGTALLLLAFADVQSGGMTTARVSMQSAAERFEAVNDFFAAWIARTYLAGTHMADAEWGAALPHHEDALVVLKKAESSTAPFSLDSVMVLGPMVGMPTAGFEMFESQPGLIKSLLLQVGEMISRDLLGSCLVELGQYDRAERELTRASDLSSMFLGVYDGAIAEHWGDLRRKQQRYDEARAHYQKALEGAGRMPMPAFLNEPVELRILGHLTEIEALGGRFTEALAWNDLALTFVRERQQTSREALLLDNRADIFLRANRFDEARAALDRAWKIVETSEDVAKKASVLTTIGMIETLRGNNGAAAVELGKAIDLYRSVNDSTGETGAWMLLAVVYLEMRAHDSVDEAVKNIRDRAKTSQFASAPLMTDLIVAARNFMSQQGSAEDVARALDAVSASPELQSMPETWVLLEMGRKMMAHEADPFSVIRSIPASETLATSGMVVAEEIALMVEARELLLRGELQATRAALRKALEINGNGDLRRASLLMMAITYVQEGKYEEAKRSLKEATDAIDDDIDEIADEELLALYLGDDRQSYFALTVDILALTNDWDEAFAYAERARARAFLQAIGNRRIDPQRGSADHLVWEAESLRIEIGTLQREGKKEAVAAKRNQYRALMRRLRTSNPEYASLTRIEPLGTNAVRAEIPPGTTLVSYFPTGTNLHVWVIDHDTCDYLLIPVSLDTWKRIVCWSSRLRTGGRGAKVVTETCSDQATGEEAFAALFAPLRDRIRHRRLIVIPHGVLHQIPFAALRDPKSGRYLIEDYTLLFAPSASTLPFLREKETPVTGSALVLGDPDGSLGKLQGAQREALSVARDLGTTALIGAEAKESLLYQLDGSVDLLHIGAHGEYSAKNPLFSRIALAPGDGHDGELEVDEILNRIDLRGVNLVVLSACRTAVGERSGGDDVVGLTRAVLYAGSPGVISTLWDIDDDAAAVLMEELYCRLLDGTAVADALREAQLRLLHSDVYGDPRYWGAFLLTGDPQGRFNGPGAR